MCLEYDGEVKLGEAESPSEVHEVVDLVGDSNLSNPNPADYGGHDTETSSQTIIIIGLPASNGPLAHLTPRGRAPTQHQSRKKQKTSHD